MADNDGVSVHSPCKAGPSNSKDEFDVELEIKFLEAIAIYPLNKLRGMHRHFVIYGLMENLRKSFGKHFSSTDVLQLLNRFYDMEMMKPGDDDSEMSGHEEFCLPQSYFVKDE